MFIEIFQLIESFPFSFLLNLLIEYVETIFTEHFYVLYLAYKW